MRNANGSTGPTTAFPPGASLGDLGESLVRYEAEHRAFVEETPDLVAPVDPALRLSSSTRRWAKRSAGRSVKFLAAGAVLAVLDARGIARFCRESSRRRLGLTRAQVVWRPLDKVIHPEDVAHVLHVRATGPRTPGFSQRVETSLRHADGTWRQFAVLRKTVVPAGHSIVVLNARDVTGRRGIERAARRIRQTAALGRMPAGIPREFNRFLSTIRGTTDLLANDPIASHRQSPHGPIRPNA